MLICLLAISSTVFAQKTTESNFYGTWKADCNESGMVFTIYFTLNADGSASYRFYHSGVLTQSDSSKWCYDTKNNILFERFTNGAGAGDIQFVNSNEFYLTIAGNQAGDNQKGVVRHYQRVVLDKLLRK